jgi:pantoate--beta-alanine ligase
MPQCLVLETPVDLAEFRGRCALVPTMGALHAGHLSLIERATQTGKPVLVSIFVNPTQFGPNEDFRKYPRQLNRDVELASAAGADVVFAPSVEAMYPPHVPIETPDLPSVATQPGLEDRIRPGHFAGVCQVVARLFDLVQPSVAVFGEKDYQQLVVIRAMVKHEAQRWGELQIVALATVRDADGLALSSRNVYLSSAEREQALGLSRALRAAAGADSPRAAEERMMAELGTHDLHVDYAVARDAETLMPIDSFDRPARALIAARLGAVRLIDNSAVG